MTSATKRRMASDRAAFGHEIAGEARQASARHAEHVVQHEHLSGGCRPRTDADGDQARVVGLHLGGHGRGHELEHHHGGPGVGQGLGVAAQGVGTRFVTPLDAVAAQGVHALRGQPQVGAHGDAPLGQEMHGLGCPAAAFELDHLGASLHQRDAGPQGLLPPFLVTAERQVAHDPHVTVAARHAPRVVDHVVQADGDGAAVALHQHAQRIAHEDAVHATLIDHPREHRVVARQHGDLLAARMHLAQAVQRHGLAGFGAGGAHAVKAPWRRSFGWRDSRGKHPNVTGAAGARSGCVRWAGRPAARRWAQRPRPG